MAVIDWDERGGRCNLVVNVCSRNRRHRHHHLDSVEKDTKKQRVCARVARRRGARMRTCCYEAAPTYGGRQGVGVQGPPSRLGLDLVEHLDEVAGAELLWHPEGRQKSLVPTELDRHL